MFVLFLHYDKIINMRYKRYDKEFDYSYSFGQFPTIELIKSNKTQLQALILHEKLKITEEISQIINYAKMHNAEVITSSKQIEAISGKENCYLVGVFKKYQDTLQSGNHVVLVSPSDSGNLGTIIRTMLGMGVENLAIIEQGKNTQNEQELAKTNTSVDIFNPKVIRASMGSIFSINVQVFHNFSDYQKVFKNNCYAFCLENSQPLGKIQKPSGNYSLVFGNEATGLAKDIIEKCTPVRIEQSNKIDSFNLAISVAIGLYKFNN